MCSNNSAACSAASGRRSEIVTSTPRDEMVVLHKDEPSQKVVGKTLRDAQCVLAARCYPQGDGAVRVELTPEIHHGTPRKQWLAGEGTFHLVTGRERETYTDLLLPVTLTPGQTLVVSCTPEFGLGHNFFLDTSHGDAQLKLLLIRLSQTQRDDLFEAERSDESASALSLSGPHPDELPERWPLSHTRCRKSGRCRRRDCQCRGCAA